MLDRMTYLCEAVKCFQTPLDFNGRISQSTENKKNDRVVLPQLTQWVLSRIRARAFNSQFFALHVTQHGSPYRKLALSSGPSGQILCLKVEPRWLFHGQWFLPWIWNLVDTHNWKLEPLSLTEWLIAQYYTISPKMVMVSRREEIRRLSRLTRWPRVSVISWLEPMSWSS